MNQFNISYLLTTFNKNKYLQTTLPFLLSHLKNNEQLIIYDGDSKDGAKELISKCIQNKSNVEFYSEPDIGEAHGLNKCILKARGKYLKIISDDDAYHFDTIRKACEWMDNHPNVDWMGSNGISYFYQKKNFLIKNEIYYYKKWKTSNKPFLLTGLGYLIRNTSISKLGLLNTNCKIVDFEYSLRNLSNPKITFALSSLPFYVNIVNPNSNSINMFNQLATEYLKYQKFYNGDNLFNIYSKYLKLKLMSIMTSINKKSIDNIDKFDFSEIFLTAYNYIHQYNQQKEFKVFLKNDKT